MQLIWPGLAGAFQPTVIDWISMQARSAHGTRHSQKCFQKKKKKLSEEKCKPCMRALSGVGTDWDRGGVVAVAVASENILFFA